ncbi:hypothetical protein [Comamonas aquatica]|uniref:hypothetical protein n=1 Tax=Comamonas aquatica TaxID=225991 RepID=UPI000AA544AF|nr:hypothetical protein [Comamonas aquatica]
MSTPIVSIAAPVATSRDVLCVHALRVLRTTAQQWGRWPPHGRVPPRRRSRQASSRPPWTVPGR